MQVTAAATGYLHATPWLDRLTRAGKVGTRVAGEDHSDGLVPRLHELKQSNYLWRWMLDAFLGRIGTVAAGVGLLLALASSTVGLGPWLVPIQVMAVVLIVGGVLAVTMRVGRQVWTSSESWNRSRGAPNVAIEPTGGPSQDVRLMVTNRGHRTEFHGTAAVVSTRNYPNRHRQGSYALMWLGRGTNIIPLDRGQSHALLLARWKIRNLGPGDRMGEVDVVECNGSQEGEWSFEATQAQVHVAT
jgi:hypothetical protein